MMKTNKQKESEHNEDQTITNIDTRLKYINTGRKVNMMKTIQLPTLNTRLNYINITKASQEHLDNEKHTNEHTTNDSTRSTYQ